MSCQTAGIAWNNGPPRYFSVLSLSLHFGYCCVVLKVVSENLQIQKNHSSSFDKLKTQEVLNPFAETKIQRKNSGKYFSITSSREDAHCFLNFICFNTKQFFWTCFPNKTLKRVIELLDGTFNMKITSSRIVPEEGKESSDPYWAIATQLVKSLPGKVFKNVQFS